MKCLSIADFYDKLDYNINGLVNAEKWVIPNPSEH
jgi:hypothetical protein